MLFLRAGLHRIFPVLRWVKNVTYEASCYVMFSVHVGVLIRHLACCLEEILIKALARGQIVIHWLAVWIPAPNWLSFRSEYRFSQPYVVKSRVLVANGRGPLITKPPVETYRSSFRWPQILKQCYLKIVGMKTVCWKAWSNDRFCP